ncbi:DUF3955 domain-containing protein [Colwellia psychrerythraea]|uniref:DUF3955 domain-containing protein n=1 Tax=Colwellia psychrerythraea TaxID=28229 RepID=A0A099KUZ8_COLPS|nr:DUF3955 domain-containing protein [Colwellia psychrerythraea]KGJ93637.1 Protein of unknown function DUF3955 [Colwellia psychrerythraea]
MNFSVNNIFFLSLLLLGLGIVFIIAENSFYQYVDDSGVLHESLFMPLGVLSFWMGILFLLFSLLQKIWQLLSHQ